MRNLSIKAASAALCALLLAGALSACGGGGTQTTTANSGATTAVAGATTPGDTSATQMSPNVPEADYGGYTFTFLAHQEPANGNWLTLDPRELVSEQENGELINDAVYKRNSVISQEFNVQFAMLTNNNELSLLKKSVAAGDNAYDCAVVFNNNVPSAITQSLLMEVSNLQYIDRSKPWWDPAANALTIDNKCYILGGDLTILDKEATNSFFFNKDMIASLGLDSPYDLVNSGNWTFDKLAEMIKNVPLDLNGDGQMDQNDRYGILTFNDTLHAMLVSGGGALAVKDANDEPVMSFATQQNLNVITKATDILYDKNSVYNMQSRESSASATWGDHYQNMFSNNQGLFIWARLSLAEFLRDVDINFGIIPMPKYDTNQANYSSLVNPYTGVMIGVPKSCPDTARTSTILEALSCESHYTLQPAYYDETLQRKMVRDNESSSMLDIIFANKVYDIGAVYSFGNVFTNFSNLYNNYNSDVASFYAKNEAAFNTAIAKVVAIFQSNS